jgi:hydrogenase expression/formation protein HypD
MAAETDRESMIGHLAAAFRTYRTAEPLMFMEVCGTHTMAIHRAGIPSILPDGVRLVSGPGCPVCVTPAGYVDTALRIARKYTVSLATFGDMLKVPGSEGTLAEAGREGRDIRVVYSPSDALRYAQENPECEVVFLAVGFETTAPIVAETVLCARRDGIGNFSILAAHKLIIPALRVLLDDSEIKLHGFLLPGHVSVVIGAEPYRFIPELYRRGAVITGFEPEDILQGLAMLLRQARLRKYRVEIQYTRAVRPEGNPQARMLMDTVFTVTDAVWRGFGNIPGSGLRLRNEFSGFDALQRFPVASPPENHSRECRCGDILRGRITPPGCRLFGDVCTPHHPVGPCMVSTEGTCAAYYRYNRP